MPTRTVIFYQRTLFKVILICGILLTGCNRQRAEAKQLNLVFRLDDYSALSSTDMEIRIIYAFRKNEASITISVIPFVCAGDLSNPSPQDIVPLTSMKGDILRTGFKDGILDVALHGYSHQTISTKQLTEFSGLDYDRQIERLSKGKKLLEGIIDAPVSTFAPPWNRYDLNTLRALEDLGFSTLSADQLGESTKDSKLNFLPYSCGLLQLRDAVEAARTSSDNQPLIVVLFHLYDFREIDEKQGSITFQEFYDLLSWLKSQRDVRLLSIRQATEVIKDLSAKRLLLAKWNRKLLNSLWPSSLREEGSTLLYPETPDLLKTTLKVGSFYLLIVILGTALSFGIGRLVFPRFAFILKYGAVVIIVLSVIMLIYVFYDLQVYRRGMLASAGVIGISIGLFISSQYVKRKGIWVRNSAGKKDQA